MAVEVGFVEGITAATTPMGSAISVTRVAGILPQHPDRAQGPDVGVDVLRREEVLRGLVLDVAEAGLLVGQPGQALGLGPRRRRHRVHDAVDLLLGEPRQDPLGRARLLREGRAPPGSTGGPRPWQPALGFFAAGQDLLDLRVRAAGSRGRHELAHPAGGGGSRVGRGLHRAHVAAHEHGHVAGRR